MPLAAPRPVEPIDGTQYLKALHYAATHNCQCKEILQLAAFVASANMDDAQLAAMWPLALSDEELKRHSRRISDEEWQELQDFASELKKLIDG